MFESWISPNTEHSSSIDFIHFLRFHHEYHLRLARFSCLQTAQTTANIRHLFRVSWIYPTAHPVSISPATFNLMSNQSRQKNSFLVFD